jgi:hypothetical protein
MALSWGQGKIEVTAFGREIRDFLVEGLTESEIFRRLKEKGLAQGKRTFHRSIKTLKAEQPAALPALASKARPPKVSDQRSLTSSATPSVPSDGEEGMSKRAQFHLSSQRDPSELI